MDYNLLVLSWLFFSCFGYFVGSHYWDLYTKPILLDKQLEKDNVALREYINHLEKVLAGEVVVEESGQQRWIVEDTQPDKIKVPYTIQIGDLLAHYVQVWRAVDWRNHHNPDLIWVIREEQGKKGKTLTKKMWIYAEDFNPETDQQASYKLDFENIRSNMPCSWEYLGWSEVA